MANDKENNENKIKLLNSLIRKASSEDAEKSNWPDVDTITAYLLGQASDDQIKIMRMALIISADFRKEILQLANEIENVKEIEPDLIIKSTDDHKIPSLGEFLNQHKRVSSVQGDTISVWNKLLNAIFPPGFIPSPIAVVAAFLIITLAVIHNSYRSPENWPLVYSQQDINYWRSQTTRGSGSKIYSDPQEAAIDKFRNYLEYNVALGSFNIKETQGMESAAKVGRAVLVKIITDSERLIDTTSIIIPNSDKIKAWAMDIDNLTIYSIEAHSDEVVLTWSEKMGEFGFVTFTYKDNNSYRTTRVFTFKVY